MNGDGEPLNVLIFPFDSLILYDLVARLGHTPLGIVEAKVGMSPEVSPPYGITSLHPTLGLQSCPVEVPAGVRGRLAILVPLLDQADACVFMQGEDGFCESGCEQTNLYMRYLAAQKGLPVLDVTFPEDEVGGMRLIEALKGFLGGIFNV